MPRGGPVGHIFYVSSASFFEDFSRSDGIFFIKYGECVSECFMVSINAISSSFCRCISMSGPLARKFDFFMKKEGKTIFNI